MAVMYSPLYDHLRKINCINNRSPLPWPFPSSGLGLFVGWKLFGFSGHGGTWSLAFAAAFIPQPSKATACWKVIWKCLCLAGTGRE